MKGTNVILIFITWFLFGCATGRQGTSADGSSDPSDHWIKGTLSCLEDGAVYSFRIEKKRERGGTATGGVVAVHPSGARYTGQYTGIVASGGIHVQDNSYNSANGGWRSNIAQAQASLTSTNGSVIQLRMEIVSGRSPHGIGQGLDNHGNHYQVQF